MHFIIILMRIWLLCLPLLLLCKCSLPLIKTKKERIYKQHICNKITILLLVLSTLLKSHCVLLCVIPERWVEWLRYGRYSINIHWLLRQPEEHKQHFRNNVLAALGDGLWGMNSEVVLLYSSSEFKSAVWESEFLQCLHCSQLCRCK